MIEVNEVNGVIEVREVIEVNGVIEVREVIEVKEVREEIKNEQKGCYYRHGHLVLSGHKY
jgi:hypothetical protein